jgi:hypothetical protein
MGISEAVAEVAFVMTTEGKVERMSRTVAVVLPGVIGGLASNRSFHLDKTGPSRNSIVMYGLHKKIHPKETAYTT